MLSLNEGTTYLVHRLAGAIGLKPGDYEVIAVGGAPTRWKLLQEGKIDAGLQPFPLSYEAEAAGFTNFGPIRSTSATTCSPASMWTRSGRRKIGRPCRRSCAR